MKRRLTLAAVSPLFLAVAVTGLVFKTNSAIAQQTAEEMEEIVVEAPIVRRELGRTAAGAKTEIIELRRRVNYADLDLSKYKDVMELKARIKTTARESCEKLDEMFPLTEASGSEEILRCTDKAIAGTENKVEAAIDAAAS